MTNPASKTILAVLITVLIVTAAGCSGPVPRMGCYGVSSGTPFLDLDNLGKHSYSNPFSAKRGVVYTSRGGFIDMPHLRIAADNTRHLSEKAREHLTRGDLQFTFKLNVDPTIYTVHIEYPYGWEAMPHGEREQIIEQVSPELGQYFTYTMTTWHEVLTWFGYKCLGFAPEFSSAFSCEDIYSNLLGTRIGREAMQDKQRGYNEAMTILIRQELQDLGVQPREVAQALCDSVKGKWFTEGLGTDIRERNMDIGLDDGYVTPTLVPGQSVGIRPRSLPAASLDATIRSGFSIEIELDPRVAERDAIYRVAGLQGSGLRIRPLDHMMPIMAHLRDDAARRGYNSMPYVESPYLARRAAAQ